MRILANQLTVQAWGTNRPAAGTSLNTLAATASNQSVLTMSPGGNIGVGTTAPQAALHVASVAAFTSNVGIGTTIPTAALQVSGNIVASAIRADNMGMFRNKVINGDMRLDTRNAGGVAGTSGGTAMAVAAADKWTVATGQHSPTLTAQQVALSAADQAACGHTYAAQIQPTSVPLGLGAYFPFDGTLRDASGNNVVLTQTGTALYVPGRVGSQAVYLPNEANVSAGTAAANYLTSSFGSFSSTSSFSICMWINPSKLSAVSNNIFSTNNSGNAITNTVHLYINSSYKIASSYWGQSTNAGTTTIAINTWYHIVLTLTGTTNKIYLNGVNETTESGTQATTTGFILGSSYTTYTYPFAGYIDDFRIYNRVLTQAEINVLAGLTPYQPTLPATNLMTSYFPLDGNLNDAVAANNLTGTGTITYRGGVVGAQCAYFANEANVNVNVAANYASGIIPTVGTSGPITISCWINTTKMSSVANYYPNPIGISTGVSSTSSLYIYNNQNTSHFYASVYNGTNFYPVGPFTASINTWYHMVLTWVSNTLSFYVNGVLIGTDTTSVTIQANTRYLLLGGGSISNGAFAGYIDDIRIFNGTALTPAQIAAIYYSTNTTYANFQQSIDAGQLADFNWGTAAAMPATLTAWLKNNTPVAQAFSLSVNSTGLIAHLPFDNSYDDAVGAGFLSAPQVLASTAFTSTAGNFKVGSYGLDLTANTIGVVAVVSGISYSMPSYVSFPLTYSLWYKPSAYGDFQIIAAIGTRAGYFVSLTLGQSGIPYFDGSLITGYSGANFIPTVNTWHYACIIIDSLNVYMYIDGIMFAKSSLSSSAIITTSDAFLTLGGRQNLTVYPFKGYIDDLRIYNRALTPAQVKALYDANSASTTAPTSAAITLPVRNFVYNTPSIAAGSWAQIQATLPADSTGAWETRPGQPAANLALCLGAGPSYSNVSTGVWTNNTEYIGGSTQLINSSATNFLANSSNAVLFTGVQLEKGALATGYEVRPTNMEALLSGILLANNVVIQKRITSYYQGTHIETYSTTYVNSGISVSITPLVSNSRVFVSFISNGYSESSRVDILIYRNGSIISPNSIGFGGTSITNYFAINTTVLDTPNTTNTLTYTIYYKSSNGNRAILAVYNSQILLTAEEIIIT